MHSLKTHDCTDRHFPLFKTLLPVFNMEKHEAGREEQCWIETPANIPSSSIPPYSSSDRNFCIEMRLNPYVVANPPLRAVNFHAEQYPCSWRESVFVHVSARMYICMYACDTPVSVLLAECRIQEGKWIHINSHSLLYFVVHRRADTFGYKICRAGNEFTGWKWASFTIYLSPI